MVSPAIALFGSLYVPEAVLMGSDAANIAQIRAVLTNTGCAFDVTGLHDDISWLAGDVRRSRQVADVIMVGSTDSWTTPWLRKHVLETLVRTAGTPIVIFPAGQSLSPIKRAVLGWKPSPEANRALHDLVAIAEPGASIDVITVGARLDECERERETHAEVKRHLPRHGFAAQGHRIVNDDRVEAETLTIYAHQTNADLLVIGGFAHSRIREIVLGGVTHDLVRQSEVPTLIFG